MANPPLSTPSSSMFSSDGSISTIDIPLRSNHRHKPNESNVVVSFGGCVRYRSCGGQTEEGEDKGKTFSDNRTERIIDLIQNCWVLADLNPSLEISVDVSKGLLKGDEDDLAAVLEDIGFALVSSDVRCPFTSPYLSSKVLAVRSFIIPLSTNKSFTACSSGQSYASMPISAISTSSKPHHHIRLLIV